MVREIERKAISGWLVLPILLAVLIGSVYRFVGAVATPVPEVASILLWVGVFLVSFVCWLGFFVVNPNEAKVLQLFGSYVGTAKNPGLRWRPFSCRRPDLDFCGIFELHCPVAF